MRYLASHITADIQSKLVMLMGPRQVGKTTLAQQIAAQFAHPVVLNYDVQEERRRIDHSDWLPSTDCLVLDELHKKREWKSYLKGIADSRPKNRAVLVTGSARLETFRQSGESLAGRYYSYRLMPYTVKELVNTNSTRLPSSGGPATKEASDALDHLMRFGGFPEPLFAGTQAHRARWESQYFNDMVREDILEFSRLHELRSMRLLLELLRQRTGSTLSYQSLAQDLGVSPNTVRSYVDVLQALHIVFLIHPYHRNIARALSKAPKLYFYDWAYLPETTPTERGAKFENLVAVSLLKHLYFLQDTQGKRATLHYLQTTTGKEVDFVIAADSLEAPLLGAVEVKLSDAKPSHGLRDLLRTQPHIKAVQLVYQLRTPYGYEHDGKRIEIQPAATWLNSLSA